MLQGALTSLWFPSAEDVSHDSTSSLPAAQEHGATSTGTARNAVGIQVRQTESQAQHPMEKAKTSRPLTLLS